jgi:hypothetical protein
MHEAFLIDANTDVMSSKPNGLGLNKLRLANKGWLLFSVAFVACTLFILFVWPLPVPNMGGGRGTSNFIAGLNAVIGEWATRYLLALPTAWMSYITVKRAISAGGQ